jgi:drug/metabolite transporter (DMT)-like permease
LSSENILSTLRRIWDTNPYILLTLVPLFWAGNAVIARGVNSLIAPITLAWLRWLVAWLLLLPFAWPHWRADWERVRASWRMLLLLSVLGISAFNTLLYVALQTTQAINASLLLTAGPAVIVVFSSWWFHERAQVGQWGSLLLCFVGVAFVLFRGSWETVAQFEMVQGDLWLVVAILCYAAYSALLRLKPDLHPLTFLNVTFALGGGLLTPLMLGEWVETGLPAWSWEAGFAVVYVAIFPSIFAFLFWNRGIELIGASQAGLFINLIPVFAALLAVFFLGESFAWFHGVGMSLIIGGMWLFRRQGRAEAPALQQQEG